MRDALAERLLARVMDWSAEDVSRERPDLQVLAALKYDEYQQFAPGMRFIESLAIWLSQFKSPEERRSAFSYVRERLVFCSAAEMHHLVAIAFPDFIRPRLIRAVATELSLSPYHVARVVRHPLFTARQRQCLFLGLSDGARTDVFRRANRELSHEQVLLTHEVASDRVENLLSSLRADIARIADLESDAQDSRFRSIAFLDDFSGSGLSVLRREENQWHGKLMKFFRAVTDPDNAMSALVDHDALEVFLVLYVASETAIAHLEQSMRELWSGRSVKLHVLAVLPLQSELRLERTAIGPMVSLLNSYYDPALCDEHIEKGDTDGRFGFADGGLPLVLHHNTPNNSVSLLWAGDHLKIRGLFPRVSRHREES